MIENYKRLIDESLCDFLENPSIINEFLSSECDGDLVCGYYNKGKDEAFDERCTNEIAYHNKKVARLIILHMVLTHVIMKISLVDLFYPEINNPFGNFHIPNDLKIAFNELGKDANSLMNADDTKIIIEAFFKDGNGDILERILSYLVNMELTEITIETVLPTSDRVEDWIALTNYFRAKEPNFNTDTTTILSEYIIRNKFYGIMENLLLDFTSYDLIQHFRFQIITHNLYTETEFDEFIFKYAVKNIPLYKQILNEDRWRESINKNLQLITNNSYIPIYLYYKLELESNGIITHTELNNYNVMSKTEITTYNSSHSFTHKPFPKQNDVSPHYDILANVAKFSIESSMIYDELNYYNVNSIHDEYLKLSNGLNGINNYYGEDVFNIYGLQELISNPRLALIALRNLIIITNELCINYKYLLDRLDGYYKTKTVKNTVICDGVKLSNVASLFSVAEIEFMEFIFSEKNEILKYFSVRDNNKPTSYTTERHLYICMKYANLIQERVSQSLFKR